MSGERRAAAAGQERGAVVAAESHDGKNVFFIARNYDADRDLAIVGAIGCIDGATAGVEANFSAKVTAECSFKRGGVDLGRTGRGWSDSLRHRAQNIFVDTGVVRKGLCGAGASPAKLRHSGESRLLESDGCELDSPAPDSNLAQVSGKQIGADKRRAVKFCPV